VLFILLNATPGVGKLIIGSRSYESRSIGADGTIYPYTSESSEKKELDLNKTNDPEHAS